MQLPTYSHMCSLIKTQSNECTTFVCSTFHLHLDATNLRTLRVFRPLYRCAVIHFHTHTFPHLSHRERVGKHRQSACKHVIYSNLYNSSKRTPAANAHTRGAYYANSFSTRQIGKKATANARARARQQCGGNIHKVFCR